MRWFMQKSGKCFSKGNHYIGVATKAGEHNTRVWKDGREEVLPSHVLTVDDASWIVTHELYWIEVSDPRPSFIIFSDLEPVEAEEQS